MKKELRATVELLRNRVAANLELIRYNESVYKEILQTREPSSDRSKLLTEGYQINKKYLDENRESLRLQMSIIKFLSDFSEQLTPDANCPAEQPDLDAIFEQTINGQLRFDSQHPLFTNNAFFDRLMDFYLSAEAFERCAELQSMRLMAN